MSLLSAHWVEECACSSVAWQHVARDMLNRFGKEETGSTAAAEVRDGGIPRIPPGCTGLLQGRPCAVIQQELQSLPLRAPGGLAAAAPPVSAALVLSFTGTMWPSQVSRWRGILPVAGSTCPICTCRAADMVGWAMVLSPGRWAWVPALPSRP